MESPTGIAPSWQLETQGPLLPYRMELHGIIELLGHHKPSVESHTMESDFSQRWPMTSSPKRIVEPPGLKGQMGSGMVFMISLTGTIRWRLQVGEYLHLILCTDMDFNDLWKNRASFRSNIEIIL